MEPTFSPEDFADLLGEDLVLVGGQAVNFWGLYFADEEPDVQSFMPLTSEDADFYSLAKRLTLSPGWKASDPPRKGRMRLVSKIVMGPEGQRAEILRSVNGLTEDDIRKGSVSVQFEGRPIFILNPVALFRAKKANLRSLDQTNRQDEKHLRILQLVARRFLYRILQEHERISRPTNIIQWLNFHFDTVTQPVHCNFVSNWTWEDLFPFEAITSHNAESVQNFMQRIRYNGNPQENPTPSL